MNPEFIRFKNFRSYKDETILFPHQGVMPIVGKNGRGKSSIFYGMLLALYGKVIIGDSETSVKELITDDGSKDMEVQYKFSHDGATYDIMRAYHLSITKKGVAKCDQVKCELNQIIDGREISLTAKSKGNTSEKLIEILGKDCSNFCNSAFFPQDEANRLARLRPAEFIEEISKLKKITIWEALREKAASKLDKVVMMIGSIDNYIENCKEIIERKPSIEQAIDRLNKDIVTIKAGIKKIEKELQGIIDEKTKLLAIIEDVSKIEADVVSVRNDIDEFNNDIDSINSKIDEENSIVCRKAEIESNFSQFQSVEQNKVVLDQALMNRNSLMSHISEIENEVNNAKQNVEIALTQAIATHDNALASLQNATVIRQQYENCRQTIDSFSQLQVQIDELGNNNQQIIKEIATLKANNENLSVQINEETEKMQAFMKNRICFECERPVDENGMNFIKEKKIQKIDNFKAQGRENVERITQLEQQLTANHKQISSLNDSVEQKSAADRELGNLESQISNIETAQETVNNLSPEIDRLKYVIDSGSYSDKTDELVSIRQQLDMIVYDPNEHESVNSTYDTLKDIGILKQKLERAEVELPDLMRRKDSINGKIETKEKRLSELSESLQSFDRSDINSKLNIVKAQEEEAKSTLSTKQDQFSELMKEFGAQQQIMEDIIRKEKELEEKIEEVVDLKEEQFLLERAIEMYSKSGIPTLIIENMLPEIENQANELLRVMRADRMVSFERPRKADGTYQEKIVIMIRDRRGQKRTFNTYSGAECFQISFAIRVAICGGEDVMFIDEGFGKLDEDNLQLIMRTLSAMKTKFDKIILITHVKDLIDMFDVKLHVKINDKGYSETEWTKVA
jgi:exonuclease SbcC